MAETDNFGGLFLVHLLKHFEPLRRLDLSLNPGLDGDTLRVIDKALKVSSKPPTVIWETADV